jgi:S-adenosylmethionine synthetase
MTYLRPDSKSQVTIEYSDDNQPIRIEAIVVSTQHDEFILAKKIQMLPEQRQKLLCRSK